MTLIQCSSEWEANFHDDSDWYVVCYNTETDSLVRVCVGTTRAAGCAKHSGPVCYECSGVHRGEPSDELKAKIRVCKERTWRERMIESENNIITNPRDKDLGAGVRVVLKEEVRNRPRTETEEQCNKCLGSGKWVNPNKPSDERKCFTCDGSGKKKVKRASKGKMIFFAPGTKGEVLRVFKNRSQHGTWDYGSTVVIRTDDGSEIRARIDAVSLDRRPDLERIEEYIKNHADNVYPLYATSSVSLV